MSTEPFMPDNARVPDTPLKEKVVAALKTIYDPEIPVNVYDLGLVYRCDVDTDSGKVDMEITLTSPNCPEAETLPGQMQQIVEQVEGVNEVKMDLVWDPPFTMDMLSEAARLELNL